MSGDTALGETHLCPAGVHNVYGPPVGECISCAMDRAPTPLRALAEEPLLSFPVTLQRSFRPGVYQREEVLLELSEATVRALTQRLDERLGELERVIGAHALGRCAEGHQASGHRHDNHERDLKAIADELVPLVAELWRKVFRSPMPDVVAKLRPSGGRS